MIKRYKVVLWVIFLSFPAKNVDNAIMMQETTGSEIERENFSEEKWGERTIREQISEKLLISIGWDIGSNIRIIFIWGIVSIIIRGNIGDPILFLGKSLINNTKDASIDAITLEKLTNQMNPHLASVSVWFRPFFPLFRSPKWSSRLGFWSEYCFKKYEAFLFRQYVMTRYSVDSV